MKMFSLVKKPTEINIKNNIIFPVKYPKPYSVNLCISVTIIEIILISKTREMIIEM
ncbi:hypothetical protein GCM10023311_23780 [Flaviramulus aquimarinus]|uniref:Uncharacterized protein n=1 Tax=Flaviramulus aquimarinus TaxID=1170456 RepID=A0ABP9FBZ5_9FLAO